MTTRNPHNAWRNKPAASERPLDPGAGGRPSTPIGRSQVIKSSVAADPNRQSGGQPVASLLHNDNFGRRDVLDPGPGHVHMTATATNTDEGTHTEGPDRGSTPFDQLGPRTDD
jgi:hypothetical protein